MNDETKIPKGLTPGQAFIYALLVLAGAAVVWTWDRIQEREASQEAAGLHKQVEECIGLRANAEANLSASDKDREQCHREALLDKYDAQQQISAALNQEKTDAEHFLAEYKTLVERVAAQRESYDAAKSNPDALTERRNAVMSNAIALVNFVKQWRAILPYLCTLLDGNIEAMDQQIQRGNANDVLNLLQRVRDNFDGQQVTMRTLVDQAAAKPMTGPPCQCTPTPK